VRFGLVVRRLSTQGGTERFVHGFARYLVARGHEVRAQVLEHGDHLDGVEVCVAPRAGRGRVGHSRAMQAWADALPRQGVDRVLGFVRVGGVDLYRAGGGSHAAWLESRPGRRVGRADRWELEQEARALSARTVVANSQMAARELVEGAGVAPERVHVIHNGVDLERFGLRAAEGSEHEGPVVLFLGHGFARKGLETALRAMVGLSGARLWVGGQDRRQGRFRRMAQRLGLGERVRFLGEVERPEELLGRAAALVLPTRYDPFANVTLEALACGVPVITSARNGATEVLPEAWMSVSDPHDADGFRRALVRALREDGLRERCRAAAERHPEEGAFRRLFDLALESR